MKMAEQVKQEATEIVSKGGRPTVSRLSKRTGLSNPDIHRCLNLLEDRNEIKTYTKEVLGRKHRLVEIKRR